LLRPSAIKAKMSSSRWVRGSRGMDASLLILLALYSSSLRA
jgi:hypothetical protein